MNYSKFPTLRHPIEIGILEIQGQVQTLSAFSRICKTNNTNVNIFTTEELFSRFKTYLKDKKDYKFVLRRKRENIYSFLKRVENICNEKIDLLFVNTIYETIFDLIYYLKFQPKCKMILTVHHANAWLKPKLVFNIKHPIRSIDTNLSSALISKFIFPKFDAINVIYYPIKEYIIKNAACYNYHKEIFTLPGTIFDNNKIVKNNLIGTTKLRVVIPGFIQKQRRDYTTILSVFEKLYERFGEDIILYVTGWPLGKYGNSIYNAFNQIKKKGYHIVLFDSFVPDDEFNQILKHSDIILAPILIDTKSDGEIKEQYGVTVGSGSVFDAIQFAKPIIVPSEFNMIEELKSSTLTYVNSGELEKIIADLVLHPEKLAELKRNAIINSEKFSLEHMHQYFEKNVLNWLYKETIS